MNMKTMIGLALALCAGAGMAAGCPAGKTCGAAGVRTAALEASAWKTSQWLAAADAPVAGDAEKKRQRAADGTSWFVGEVANEGDVKRATWMTTGLGVYELYVNGTRVGRDALKPGYTHVKKTRRSFTYDVTALVKGAKGAGRRAAALVTAMDEPLGFAVGNANEVREALDVLMGRPRARDVAALSVRLAAWMVSLARNQPLADAEALCRRNLENGAAYKRFARMVALQGGDLEAFRRQLMEPVPVRMTVAGCAGFVAAVDAEKVARAAFLLGAGRETAQAAIDVRAGVDLCVARGDRVEAGVPLARVATATRPERLEEAAALVQEAVAWADEPPPARNLVLEEIA